MEQKWDNYGTLLEHFSFFRVLVCYCAVSEKQYKMRGVLHVGTKQS